MTAFSFALLTTIAAFGAPPRITIDTPEGGWNSTRITDVSGQARNAKRAMLVINGSERPLQLDGNGRFKAVFLASPGRNQVSVIAWNQNGQKGERHLHFYARVPKLDLVVMLYWDTDGTDIDLHVTEPSGEECYYGHRHTQNGGMLDVDDVDGYGPEVFTLANAAPGKYQVKVKYFSDNGHPQTLSFVDVVLYPGSDREQRFTFEHMLTKTGDTEEIGIFEVSQDGQLVVD